MGIRESNQAVRTQNCRPRNGFHKTFGRLERQAVDKVHIDACPFAAKNLKDHLRRQQRRAAVDRLQHLFIEILHTEAEAIETRLRQRLP